MRNAPRANDAGRMSARPTATPTNTSADAKLLTSAIGMSPGSDRMRANAELAKMTAMPSGSFHAKTRMA